MIVSGAVVALVVVLADRWRGDTSDHDMSVLDRLYMPLLGGVVVGRLIALALDDPTSLGAIRSILVIRGGVEFWPGVAAFAALVAWSGRRRGTAAVRHATLCVAATASSPSRRNTKSAAVRPASEALDGAIETCAAASAPASFKPSPTINGRRPWCRIFSR